MTRHHQDPCPSSTGCSLAISLLAGIVALGCATASWKEQTAALRVQSLTRNAFARAETALSQLRPGPTSVLAFTECSVATRKDGGGGADAMVACDGWVGPLSGDSAGWYSGIGEVYGASGEFLYGSHVYGYVHESQLVPRYRLKMRGDRIGRAEYDRLTSERRPGVGRVRLPGEPSDTYFKNLTISEIQKLSFEAPDPGGVRKTATGSETRQVVMEWFRSGLTFERFERTQSLLRNIKVGTNKWEVIRALGGRFHTYDFAESYVLFMDGFLNLHDKYRWEKATSGGVLKVWPFGYLNGDIEVPRLDLIFLNEEVVALDPHAPRETVLRNLGVQ